MTQAINDKRRARNKLRNELGLTMKQLRKRRILKAYSFTDGSYVLDNSSQAISPGHEAA